jgi:hypothetical protein
MSIDEAKKLIDRQISELEKLRGKYNRRMPASHEPWRQQTRRILGRIFGEESPQVEQFMDVEFAYQSIVGYDAERARYDEGLDIARATLESFKTELDLLPPPVKLKCSKCGSNDLKFLEIAEIGGAKYKVAVPMQIVGAEWAKGKKAAYYQCQGCNTVFYTEPFKTSET